MIDSFGDDKNSKSSFKKRSSIESLLVNAVKLINLWRICLVYAKCGYVTWLYLNYMLLCSLLRCCCWICGQTTTNCLSGTYQGWFHEEIWRWQSLDCRPQQPEKRVWVKPPFCSCFFNNISNSFWYCCRPKLKEQMQYCVDHPEEISQIAKVKAQVSEVKGVMMQNIEKVYTYTDAFTILVA